MKLLKDKINFNKLLKSLLTILFAFIMGALAIFFSGKNAFEAYKVLFTTALGDKVAIANTLLSATPLIFTGLGAAIAFRSGIFNVGVEGSLYLGAFAAAWVGFTFISLPGIALIPLCFIAGAIIGGLWCFLPGLLKVFLDVDETVITLLLNYIAILFTTYLVLSPFAAPAVANAMSPVIAPSAKLQRLVPPSQFNITFFLALFSIIIVTIILKNLNLGYEIKTIGDNPIFAKWIGIPVNNVILKIMLIGGMLGGIAGAGQILGVHYRFIANLSPGLGFTGITIAILANNSPIGVLFASLLFGVLRNGGATMEMFTDVPRDMIRILEATIILFTTINFSLEWLKSKKNVVKE